jgi:hypothetical protein
VDILTGQQFSTVLPVVREAVEGLIHQILEAQETRLAPLHLKETMAARALITFLLFAQAAAVVALLLLALLQAEPLALEETAQPRLFPVLLLLTLAAAVVVRRREPLLLAALAVAARADQAQQAQAER